jgi:hypothetical protein
MITEIDHSILGFIFEEELYMQVQQSDAIYELCLELVGSQVKYQNIMKDFLY